MTEKYRTALAEIAREKGVEFVVYLFALGFARFADARIFHFLCHPLVKVQPEVVEVPTFHPQQIDIAGIRPPLNVGAGKNAFKKVKKSLLVVRLLHCRYFTSKLPIIKNRGRE